MTVICISGQSSCGSTTAGSLLAKKLGLKFFSAGKYFKSQAKKSESETDKMIEVWKSEKGLNKEFHKKIDEEIYRDLKKEGNIVIEGKLVIYFNPDADLKVWMKASDEVRIKRIKKRDNIPFDQALDKLREKDKLEREGFKKIYEFDFWEQEKKADLVIDSSDLTPEEIVEKIIEFTRTS